MSELEQYQMNTRVIKFWVKELTKAHEEVARSVERAKIHGEEILRYTTRERMIGLHSPSNDPLQAVVTARYEVEKLERLFEQTMWLVGVEPATIEIFKAQAIDGVSERFAYFYAEA